VKKAQFIADLLTALKGDGSEVFELLPFNGSYSAVKHQI
jgi:hypothetical protein